MKTFILLSVLLVLASSSHKQEFICKSGESLPVGVVCDLKEDCQDGSDEEFCGTCDFEKHTCGWTDTSDTSYSWRWQMANISTVPGEDHTTETPWGHVMHINGSEEGGMFPEATLEYLVVHQAALACQISFWYHINDNTSPSSSSSLEVIMIRGSAEILLLEISDGRTNGWENATAFIGNQPGGFKLRFVCKPSILSIKDVMLDDIRMEYCGQDDVPPDSDRLSCDFEKDTCSWYHDYTASLFWKRGNSKLRDLAGNGYYMFIKAAYNMNISSTARLKSIPQFANKVVCVSFWYRIFGNSIGSLRFISKRSGEPETVMWMRSGTQGNKWRFADLTIRSDKPVQMYFEAVVGGNEGTIAIDDIVVSSNEDGSCPPERECTFQSSLCGLLTPPSADFHWERMTGMSQPANSSGPIADHTLGTEQGYYLSAQLWRHSVGSRCAVMTAVMEPTPPRGECLMFWYYMEGSGVGELSVYLQLNDELSKPTQLWTRTEDQGTHWRHGRVTLLSPKTPYQVIFEATVGDAHKRDIALDDLIVLNGACPPSGFCDFEMDFCGWVNNPPLHSGLDWDWLSGSSSGLLVPEWDHTTESALGHFAFFTSVKSDSEKRAQLESETMAAVDQACLEMWHYSENWLMDHPSDLILVLFVNESSGLHQVWKSSEFDTKTWIRERVDYSSSGPHQVILQARLPPSVEGSISLDDIHIIRNKSCDELDVTTTLPPTTTTTAAPASSMDCTFEEGLCNWVHGNSDLHWTLSQGIQLDQQWDGPQYDHTLDNNQGFFLLLNGSAKGNAEQATISVPIIHPSLDMCVGFWYFMLGPSVSALDLFIQMESQEQLVWTQQGTQKREWMNAQVTIQINNTRGLKFAGHRNTQSRGFIAIDDIIVREGVCPDQGVCGFDSGLCSFENSDHDGRWVRMKGTKDHVDHTYRTDNGYYMAATPHYKWSEVAQLLSPEYSPTKEMCVRFWYWLPADPSTVLTVHVIRSQVLESALWESHGIPSGDWEVAEVTVSSPLKFNVVFQASGVSGSNSTVKIDDYSVTEEACTPTASCDFESGQCTWLNFLNEDGHDWVLARGGPPIDHITENPNGHFLLNSALHQSHSTVASEWIHNEGASFCLTLSYHVENSQSGTLRVLKRWDPSEVHVVFQTNSSGSSWSRMSKSIVTPKPFQLLIEAGSINGGSIAIDDITLTSGVCQVNETSGGFVGCTFENDTCDWVDMSFGQCQWVRGRNSSGDTGPSVDHTLGSNLGWYMTVEADRGEELSPAALESPNINQSSTSCMLHFYYNMYGEGINDLKVLLRQGSRTTALWWLSGNHRDVWQRGEVTVGRITQDLTIVFEASRTFDKPGHIALDDVGFTNCSLPEPQPSCPENMFTCNNAVCVDHRHVCDFSDDCGDWSDENNCEQHGVVEQCSFEQGLCFWAGSADDAAGDEWTRHTGHEAWPEQGPPRDHTQNSAAGHYVIPGTPLVKGQTSEILSRTLLPSINCSVRFYYFSLNDSTANMTTQIRTQHFGTNDTILWLRGPSDSYSWHRAEVRFSSSAISKLVFSYELGDSPKGMVALDDISFSKECEFDPNNSQLPNTSTTSAPPTSPSTPSTSTSPGNPCQDDEFFCWLSSGQECIPDALRCNYQPDCTQGEDEVDCGSCTFESDQCQWTVISDEQIGWERLRASSGTEPPTDHSTSTGYYMRVNISTGSTQIEAKLQSPMLAPSSPYCQILFHFYISAHGAGSLRVLMQQAEGDEAILWSRSQNTASHWIPEHLPLGLQRPHKILFSAVNGASQDGTAAGEYIAAVDDISFINCEKNYQSPALSSYGCSFEEGLCDWMQGADDELDWLLRSGPTESLNTGPAADHTTGKGKYLYMESSPPSLKEHRAQLKSLLLPPAGEKGYCLTYWYHMFGATVGTLRVFLQTTNPAEKTLVWQTSGNQQDEWREGRSHVTLQKVHQVIMEATVGGEAGDIAVDDISFISGPCHDSDLCDFEEGSCNWQQHTDDDYNWVRQSGKTLDSNTGPGSDHTTSTATGHYYYLPSSPGDQAGQTAAMSSPLYPAGSKSCVQLWYHIGGTVVGSLNVYQQSEEGKKTLIFSQTGGQGQQWRFAQAALHPQIQPYRIVVEGVKGAPSQGGGLAFDDVLLTDIQCPPREFCDFETNMCSWSNLVGGGDHGDWLRSRGASSNPISGPSRDHTTNSSLGYYIYVDSFVGQWGEESLLISDVFPSTTQGYCLTFWYLMYEDHVGTLKVYMNDRKMQAAGSDKGELKWIEASSKGKIWYRGSVQITHTEPFWFVFVYQRGMNSGGDVALDDITINPQSCFSEPAANNNMMSTGLTVSLALLAVVVIAILMFLLIRKWPKMNRCAILNEEQNIVDLSDDMHDRTDSDYSFQNILYDSSVPVASTTHSADA